MRLTERNENGIIIPEDAAKIKEMIEKLADYEDLCPSAAKLAEQIVELRTHAGISE